MNDLFNVRGKVAVITGGGRGIGEMISRGFVANGARVYIASRDPERAAAQISSGGACIPVAADLSCLAGVEQLVSKIRAKEPKVDVLVNNAGLASLESLDGFSEEDWDPVMDLNAKAVFFTTQKFLPLLRAAAAAETPARVINIASIAGVRAPGFDAFAYAASKAACVMLTRHLAKRLAREHILVNAIAPGPFATEMMAPRLEAAGDAIRAGNPLNRLGAPEDVAGCALFLASRASAWTTGAVVPCDGGAAQIGNG